MSHNGFPVVKDSPSGQVAVGLITRSHLMAVLQRIVVEGKVQGLEVSTSWGLLPPQHPRSAVRAPVRLQR